MSKFCDYLTINNIVAIILGVIGLIWVIYSIWRNRKISNINSWPKTNARIISAVAQSDNNKKIMVDTRNISQVDPSAKYIPIVTYEYRVGDMVYQSHSIIYSSAHSYSANDIAMIMNGLIPGSTIPVYYNPNNASESYIYNGITNYTNMIIGLVLLLIAIYLGYYHGKSRNPLTGSKKQMDEIEPNFTEIDRQHMKTYRTNGSRKPYPAH